ncbi:hypothetical protein ONZ45_g18483 [Pleurotus djamor]|nr:hypothetical protein ONZ45_g18483 [Pleurotus djamor]
MSTHSAVATTSVGVFEEIQVETEKPGPGELLIQHSYGAMIAFDTYQVDLGYFVETYPHILGFSASGVVADIGSGITDLKVGDRVTAFTFHGSRSKALQEYSIQPRSAVAKIPQALELAEAATIPDNFVTAFYTVFNQLGFPIPTKFPVLEPPPLASAPILVYGGGAISGQYAIQVLHAAGYKNIITTASPKHHRYLRSLDDGKVQYAIDSITSQGTIEIISKTINPSGTLALLLPIKEGSAVRGAPNSRMVFDLPEEWNVIPKGVKIVYVRTFLYDQDEFLRDNLMPKILPELLDLGLVKASKVKLMDQNTFKDRVGDGLELLRNNKVSGEKVVVKIYS